MSENDFSRRDFFGNALALGAVGIVGASALSSCSDKGGPVKEVNLNLPPLLDKAPDGKPLKAGLIGCGGRGTGAALNFLAAGPNLSITALGDVFDDRLQSCRTKIKDRTGNEVADEKCFVGFDAFEKVIDSGVDVILLATPPHFRPEQFAAAVKARKHCFLEKPVAVDPAGARSIMASSKKAEALNLKVITGTQRRHQRDYIEVYKQFANGAIGEMTGGCCYWNGSKLWHRSPQTDWSEMESHIRDWVNWTWLSGDHIVEQHVHNIDVINWFADAHPVKATAFGSRQRRITGDQFDNFSVDFEFESGMHVHSMCRQINGCTNNVSEFVQGSKGMTNCRNQLTGLDGNPLFNYEYPKNDKGEPTKNVAVSPYDQEHIDWVTSIRQDLPCNEAERTAIATMCAIMGRISAYTGKMTTYEEMLNSDIHVGPQTYIMGDINMTANVPVPGEAPKQA